MRVRANEKSPTETGECCEDLACCNKLFSWDIWRSKPRSRSGFKLMEAVWLLPNLNHRIIKKKKKKASRNLRITLRISFLLQI